MSQPPAAGSSTPTRGCRAEKQKSPEADSKPPLPLGEGRGTPPQCALRLVSWEALLVWVLERRALLGGGVGSCLPPHAPRSWPQTTWEMWPLGGLLGWTLWEARRRGGSGPGPQPAPSWVFLSLRAGLCGPQSEVGGTWAPGGFCGPQHGSGLTKPLLRVGWLQESWALTFQLSEQRGTHKGSSVSASGF